MTTDTEALRAQFERRMNLRGWPEANIRRDGLDYSSTQITEAWHAFQAGYAAAKAETVDEVAKEREHCALVHAAAREIERLRDLCDDLYSDLLAAGSLVPRDCGAYALIQEAIKLRRDRWAHKE